MEDTIKILYEDKSILVCVKPVGILSQPDGSDAQDMISLVSEYISANGERGEVGLVHRLDRNVGGVMLFSKNSLASGKLSAIIADKNFCTKEYIAVVEGRLNSPSGTFVDLLKHDARQNKSFVVDSMRKGVKEASLEYLLLSEAQVGETPVSLVRIRLHTGRTHQIRVQFASRQHSLVGDGKYGSRVKARTSHGEIALFAARLALTLPNGKKIDIEEQPPDIFPFNIFSKDNYFTNLA